MTKKRAAVIPARGIGDALLMMIASERLKREGYEVTTYHPMLKEMANYFQGHTFKTKPSSANIEQEFAPYNLIIAQNDYSRWIRELNYIFRKGKLNCLSIFYTDEPKAHFPPISSWDQKLDDNKPMADNISYAVAELLRSNEVSKNNGLVVPCDLTHRKYPKRVILHPMSSESDKRWPAAKFLQVACTLQQKGFDPYFVMRPSEKAEWESAAPSRFPVITTPKLSELASFLYESAYFIGNDSGISHLASNLYIPNLVISGHRRRIRLWRPAWLTGKLALPSSHIPNIKWFRLREHQWKRFISHKKVLSLFGRLVSNNKCILK